MLHFLIAMYRVPYTCTIYHLALSYLSTHTYCRITNFLFLPLDGAHKRVGRDTRSFNSRRSSTDSSEDGVVGGVGGVRELRQEMRDLEDKFKKAMVANASLDNEKCQLIFQVLYSTTVYTFILLDLLI